MKNKLREGQKLMWKLLDADLDAYNFITGTDADPFYVDARIPLFHEKLSEYYEKKNAELD